MVLAHLEEVQDDDEVPDSG